MHENIGYSRWEYKKKNSTEGKNISIVKQFVHENIGYIQGGSPFFSPNRKKKYYLRETRRSLDFWIFNVKVQTNSHIKGYFLFFK